MSVRVDPRSIRVVVGDLEKVTEKIVKKIALDVTANLKDTTPVDTGWARANWIPSVSAPAVGDETPVGRAARAAKVDSALSRQTTGEAQIAGYRLSMGSVYITNNVPYITLLNMGSSAKAPPGFVQAAIKKAVIQDLGRVRP